ncbi:RNA polymerase sigma factor [Nocardia jejuensis]|uniref:RNA polymerase sigma factor n=1 Tax=Nocardia jejuensis TaxID=328049 RepID=UPI00082D8723|nr:RNA polymerase sigma factor [Nocardia jejuensis]
MSAPDTPERMRRAVEAAWRIEWPRLVAGLTRMTGDIGVAEELAQDAYVAALEQWPRDGVPPNPGGWLMLTAKHRAVDRFRRDATFARKLELLGRQVEIDAASSWIPLPDSGIQDDLLRMIFTACHPVLTPPARAALTLRMVGGLSTTEIARAYMVTEPTVAQRIVRAKRTIAAKRVPYEVPHGPELTARLGSVLEVVYLIFNEGYTATSGDAWVRTELCEDALRLARILAALLPEEPETHALAALLELQASRLGARTDSADNPVLLADQDRSHWNRLYIRRGFAALARAQSVNRARGLPPGSYALQAAIAAVHAMAPSATDTDWRRIAGLYAVLAERFPSPVVELNRAVAVAMLHGPAAGLDLLDKVAATGALEDYHLSHAVRADLLERLGRTAEARDAFLRAADLTTNTTEQVLLRHRARNCEALDS